MKSPQVVRHLTKMAGSLALVIVMVPPIVVFAWSYQSEKGAVDGEARIVALLVTEFVNHSAGLWQFEQERLSLLLSKYGSNRFGFQINDLQGNSVIDQSHLLKGPLLKSSHTIYDFGKEVGSVVVSAPMYDVLVTTFAIGCIGFLLGILLFFPMRLLPARALQEATQALEESENAYRNLVELSPDGIYINKDEKIDYINAAGAKLFGAARADDLIGTSFWDRLHPDSHTLVRDRLQHIHKMKGAVPLKDERYVRLDGSEFPVEVAAAPFIHRGKKAIQVVFHDLTNRKQTESDLRHARDAAEKASMAKSEFLAVMSHEIRTPLNGVLGMAKLLHHTQMNEQQKRYTSMILGSGKSLLSIVNDILDFSKIEAGKMELDTCAFDPVQLVENVTTLLADQAHNKGLELIIDIAPDIPPSLIGDPIRLRQILVNLIGNAIKFTSSGEVLVRLASEKRSSAGTTIRFEVRDTGAGIDDSRQKDIFDSFTQSESSTTRRFGGTGLGLTISQKLVQLMGGEIRLESRLGEGSTFWLELVLPIAPTCDSTICRSNTRFTGQRVLIVGDNSTQRTILESRFGELGLQVSSVDDDNKALDLLKRVEINLAVIDLGRGSINDSQLASRIRQNTKSANLRLIFLTTMLPDHQANNSGTGDIQEMLYKPICRDDLYLSLERSLSGPGGAVLSPAFAQRSELPSFNAHILVVEDNPVNQELARAVLELLGCTLDIAEDGAEAVRANHQQNYDLILMDCFMPVMDGFTATAQIRSRENSKKLASTPIIALTANVVKGFRDQCFESGMNDFLSKPFSQDQLAVVLERWLQKSTDTSSEIVSQSVH